MNSILKYMIWCGIGALVIYFSIQIKPLDVHLTESATGKFDPEKYVEYYWNEQLSLDTAQAIMLEELQNALHHQRLGEITKKVGISDYVYTFYRGSGTVNTVNDEFIYCHTEEGLRVKIKIKYIFDSNVRNASRQIDISEFITIIDYNLVSKELNEKIRTHLDAQIKNKELTGERIEFVGAVQIHDTATQVNELIITPVNIEILP